MDLSYSKDPRTVRVLVDFILNPDEPDSLVGVAAESLGEIWARDGGTDEDLVNRMRRIAQRELIGALRAVHASTPALDDLYRRDSGGTSPR
jgi:hypothetical protein